MASVVWFRRDLRLHDNPALEAALQAGPVVPLFVVDRRLFEGHWASPRRSRFLLESLRVLDEQLRERGSRLHIRQGRPEDEVLKFANEANSSDVFVSREYTPFAKKRDGAVARSLAAQGTALHTEAGTLIHEPEDVLKDGGEPYSVFTPFFRRWRELPFRRQTPTPRGIPSVAGVDAGSLPSVKAAAGITAPELPVAAGEKAARERLSRFLRDGLGSYGDERNFPGREGTSRLSQDLRFGLLSSTEVACHALEGGQNAEKFVQELAWRDFYAHIVWHHPRVLREAFDRRYANVRWDDNPAAFEAWKAGRTGFPFVDAAMRELRETGFMHNRARMVAASFLTKDLHLDWREGEAYFMHQLTDGDPASNNGGWQWAASTGTDAQPYFRVFNPTLQGKKFDPDGEYVRRWVPELANVPLKFLHEPSRMNEAAQKAAGCVIGRDYPAPIVEHGEARGRAIAMYAEAARSD